jgi:hypothetical protein
MWREKYSVGFVRDPDIAGICSSVCYRAKLPFKVARYNFPHPEMASCIEVNLRNQDFDEQIPEFLSQ